MTPPWSIYRARSTDIEANDDRVADVRGGSIENAWLLSLWCHAPVVMAIRVCSFCGLREDEVETLVEGPRRTAICAVCVDLAADLVKERLTPAGGDLILDNIGTLATNDPRFAGVLGIVTDAAVAIRRGRIAWSGPSERIPQGLDALARLDCEGRTVLPGLIDAHTHLLFAGERSREFSLRMVGIPETEAALRAGGAESTVAATHSLDADEFADVLSARLERMLENGTTTVEASAGYCIDYDAELDLLEIAGMVHRRQPVDLVRTFDIVDLPLLPADRPETLQHLVESVFPEIGDIADAVRVSCGKDSLLVFEAHQLLQAAAALGLRTRIHSGPAAPGELQQLALDSGARVIDHCANMDHARAVALGEAGAAAVVTPTTVLANREENPNLHQLVDAGVPIALGTDCSPAPLMVESLPLAISLAVLEMGLTPDQAVWSATRGSAMALDLRDKGWIGHGAIADLLILDADSPSHIAYRPGSDVVWKVFKQGVPVVSR